MPKRYRACYETRSGVRFTCLEDTLDEVMALQRAWMPSSLPRVIQEVLLARIKAGERVRLPQGAFVPVDQWIEEVP